MLNTKLIKNIGKILPLILLIIAFLKTGLFIYSWRQTYLRPFSAEYYGELYAKSQYVIGERSVGGIGDDGLYAYAGYYYLFQGGDTSSINFEHPPLGKYLIGLSILLFKNENVINIFYFVILLLYTYKIAIKLTNNSLLASLAVLIITNDVFFLDSLKISLLDLPLTVFFTLAVYYLLLAFNKSQYFYLSNIFWGAAASTKFFPSYVVIFIYIFLFLISFRKDLLWIYIKSNIAVLLIYFLSHLAFFYYHPSLIEFIQHKKWVFSWFRGTPIQIGNIWLNVLSGFYYDATFKLVKNNVWDPSWRIFLTLALIPIGMLKMAIKRNLNNFLYGFIVIYLFYITFATGGFLKFLMPLYPLVVIVALSNLPKFYSIIAIWIQAILSRSKAK